jgi:mRNA-degrading endonuclease toxin of MazEF toxin-antitoxin module
LLREAPIGNLEPVGADRVTNAQLESDTYVMTEKLASVRPSDLGGRIGSLGGDVMSRVARELAGLLAITPEDLGST